jgi:SAM-dependent methyltransferase
MTTPPIPPENLLAGVGPGDYVEAGELTVSLLERLAGLGPSDRVLDVGCGLGRIAWPLSRRLGERGSYEGFDVVRAYTDWCVGGLGLDPARFRFHHADVRTSFYNPQGTVEPEDFIFPWADASFDLAIATSLFTHLLPRAIAHYLGEVARILRPGGRLFASFYLLDDRVREAAARAVTDPSFCFATEHGRLHDAAVPESGVAVEADWLLAACAGAGLAVEGVHPGKWQARAGPYYQDVVVTVRGGLDRPAAR